MCLLLPLCIVLTKPIVTTLLFIIFCYFPLCFYSPSSWATTGTGDNNAGFPFIPSFLCRHASESQQLMCVLTLTLCRVGVFFIFFFSVCLFVCCCSLLFFCCDSGISFVLVRCVSLAMGEGARTLFALLFVFLFRRSTEWNIILSFVFGFFSLEFSFCEQPTTKPEHHMCVGYLFSVFFVLLFGLFIANRFWSHLCQWFSRFSSPPSPIT